MFNDLQVHKCPPWYWIVTKNDDDQVDKYSNSGTLITWKEFYFCPFVLVKDKLVFQVVLIQSPFSNYFVFTKNANLDLGASTIFFFKCPIVKFPWASYKFKQNLFWSLKQRNNLPYKIIIIFPTIITQPHLVLVSNNTSVFIRSLHGFKILSFI